MSHTSHTSGFIKRLYCSLDKRARNSVQNASASVHVHVNKLKQNGVLSEGFQLNFSGSFWTWRNFLRRTVLFLWNLHVCVSYLCTHKIFEHALLQSFWNAQKRCLFTWFFCFKSYWNYLKLGVYDSRYSQFISSMCPLCLALMSSAFYRDFQRNWDQKQALKL